MALLLIHLTESTVVAGLLAGAICCMSQFRISAAARHTLWLLAFAKFIVPSALLWSAGSQLAVFWPVRPALKVQIADLSRLLQQADARTTLTSSHTSYYSWLVIAVVCLWAGGVVYGLAVWIARLRRSAFSLSAPSEVAQSAFMQARQMLSVQKSVGFAIARDATEPVLMGIGRPLVILPESLETSLSPAELNTVLLHELAHFMRGDNLTSSLAHLVATAFWFHPLLWWMERQLSIDCEYACDEVVLALTRKPSDYASGIVKATSFAVCGAVAGVSGIGGYQFRKRLELIMSQDKNPVAPRRGRSLVTAAVMALVVVPVIGGFMSKSLLQGQTIEKRRGIEFITATASSDTPQTQQILSALKTVLNPNDTVFPVNGNDRWDKWLNEDVALLITQEERSAFLALTSESPREQFVTQFWEKRNPNPGSAVNTFKDEHYRRMAYANKRFTLQQVAGWQTDRGRTYVLMGPPDEIDSHPDRNRETWKYNLRGTPDSITISFDISDRH